MQLNPFVTNTHQWMQLLQLQDFSTFVIFVTTPTTFFTIGFTTLLSTAIYLTHLIACVFIKIINAVAYVNFSGL